MCHTSAVSAARGIYFYTLYAKFFTLQNKKCYNAEIESFNGEKR